MESKIPDQNDLANKELNDFRNTKPHHNKENLVNLVDELKTVSGVANYLNISTKLVNLKLKEFGIRVDS
jgi:hypothetical protein